MSESKPPKSLAVPESSQPPAVTDKDKAKTLEDIIQEKVPEIFDAIPEKERPKLAAVRIESTRISYRSGILPAPEELAAYNAIIPNGADRIMQMTEFQSAHRIELEKTVIGSQQRLESRGQWFGLIIALAFGGASLYAATHGQPWFASVLGGGTLVGLVSVFVYSRQQSKGEIAGKRENMMPQPMPPQSNKPVQSTPKADI